MSGDAKIIGIPLKLWWMFFFAMQICFVLGMIGSMMSKNWVYSSNDRVLRNPSSNDSENNVYYGYKFAGSLYKCTKGCTVDYKDLSDDWCSYYYEVKEKYENTEVEEIKDPYLSICAMFFTLYVGKLVYVAFEVASIVCAIFWLLGTCCFCIKRKLFKFSVFFSGAFWTFHYIAFLVYIKLTRSSLSNNCQDFDDQGKRPKLCVDDGPLISLAILVSIPFIIIPFCVVTCITHKRRHRPSSSNEELAKPEPVANCDQELEVYNLDITNTYNLHSPHKIPKDIEPRSDAATPDMIP